MNINMGNNQSGVSEYKKKKNELLTNLEFKHYSQT